MIKLIGKVVTPLVKTAGGLVTPIATKKIEGYVNNPDEIGKDFKKIKDMIGKDKNRPMQTSQIDTTEEKNQQPVQTSDINIAADDLRKYKGLLDEGLITQEDYDQKKKEILGL